MTQARSVQEYTWTQPVLEPVLQHRLLRIKDNSSPSRAISIVDLSYPATVLTSNPYIHAELLQHSAKPEYSITMDISNHHEIHDGPILASIPTTPPMKAAHLSSTLMPSAIITPPRSLPPEPSTPDIDIVIAHYNEDLTWLSPFTSNCHIYSKGNQPKPLSDSKSLPFSSLTTLPNIGRETHTYLTYITSHYDTLPPHILLLQGDIHSINHSTPAHTSLPLSSIIDLTTSLAPFSTLPIGLIHPFSSWSAINYKPGWIKRRGSTLKRSSLTPGDFYRLIFSPLDSDSNSDSDKNQSQSQSQISIDLPNTTLPTSVQFVQGACFGITREAVQRRPKAFYERILNYFEELNEVNPEEGHYMERFWYAILSDDAIEGVPRRGMEVRKGRVKVIEGVEE